jgi:hypothetical protein
MAQEKIQEIEKRIAKIKAELAKIGDMRPGSLTKQYRDKEIKRRKAVNTTSSAIRMR